ncbi:MAG: class I adenylate-forming enzyme family protein [Acidimicrobiia bacterium]
MVNLAELAIKTARLAPDAPALIDPADGAHRSFGELSRRTEQLSMALDGILHAGLGRRVAALARNSVELFELYLACASAGTLLFPLNWRFSVAQVKEALEDAEPTVVFYDSEFASIVDELRHDVKVDAWVEWSPGSDSAYEELLRDAGRRADQLRSGLPAPDTLVHQPYLAISTGGTTGIPKSAVHTQFTYGACALNYLAAARIAENDVYMMLGQLFHVVGYMPLAYLAMGRPVVILKDFDAEDCVEIIHAEKVSGFFAIATMLPRLVNATKADGRPMPSVRQVEYGGAPMGEEVIREASATFEADLIQAWGMTELGPGTYLGPEAHRRALSGDRPELLRSCGRAALLSTVAVLDEDGAPVPQDSDSMGEICHRGPNNMTGYWNKPGETADLLRDGWVHTGDGGTWDDEGYIYVVDRIKSMIICGGENIFPGEVERTLGNHPDIAEVVVVGVPDPEWGEMVKAVVVRAPGSALTEGDVSRWVEQHLASYKKPRIVDFVDQLPMTPTGKVNRKLLREG